MENNNNANNIIGVISHDFSGGKQCPLIAAFDEIRTGGLATDADADLGVVVLGGDDGVQSIVWNESDYWFASRSVAAARGQLEGRERETFERLYPGDHATSAELLGIIMKESPVGRQLKLLEPVLSGLAAGIINRVNSAAFRGQSINVSIGSLPDSCVIDSTEDIPGIVNGYVDFANALNVGALGSSRPAKIAHMASATMSGYLLKASEVNVKSIEDGLSADREIAVVGKVYEAVHAEAARKLNEIFIFCRNVAEGLRVA